MNWLLDFDTLVNLDKVLFISKSGKGGKPPYPNDPTITPMEYTIEIIYVAGQTTTITYDKESDRDSDFNYIKSVLKRESADKKK